MSVSRWTVDDIPAQGGKIVVVTGATGGLGYETALELARKGATVILVGRNDKKGAEALDKIKSAVPDAEVYFEKVDLCSLASIAAFGLRFTDRNDVLDTLINNAGVMDIPKRETTEDGFELQFGTNHLAHFALTAHLFRALRKSPHARIVNVSSLRHRRGTINFNDLQSEKYYSAWGSYSQSKLANLLFTYELNRRSVKKNWNFMCVSAHPGFARTDLISNGPGADSWVAMASRWIAEPLFSQSAADGALPTLYAATSQEVTNGAYYGPDGFFEMRGAPTTAYCTPEAQNPDVAKKLWDISESLTGVKWT